MRLLRRLLAAVLVAAGLAVALPATTPPPAGADECVDVTDSQNAPAESEGEPLEELQIRDVHDLLRVRDIPLGAGVTVAVVDSGVLPNANVTAAGPVYQSRQQSIDDAFYQGTAVAGLINGPGQGDQIVGIAPEAEVVDIQVYDSPEQSDTSVDLKASNLAAGLRVAAARRDVDIVNVSLEIVDSPELRQAVRAVTAAGKILVAPSGDRPADEDEPFGPEFATGDDPDAQSGDDAAQEIFPAGYAVDDGLVVAATSTVADGEDPRAAVLPSSATTVAAPTAGGVSYALDGQRCTLTDPSSLWAAATVSGVLALLRSAFPTETPRQLVARLTDTAAGPATSGGPNGNRFLGRGVVQPLEALERDVAPAPDGRVPRLRQPETSNEPAAIDPPDPDLLATAREDAVWWALGAGGLIAVLLLLRPVIGRRRGG